MSKINYQELREAAEQATQDEWVAYILPGHNGIYPARTSEGRHCGYFIDWPGIDGQRNAGANARYIAAIPPKVALALLGEIKRLEDTNIDAMCRIAELETNLAALVAENAGLKAFKTAVYQQMGVGCDAPEFSITVGLSNLRRFADTLHAIEREFFTKELPDEEHEGETFNECPLSWGMSVEQYVSEFRKCLAEVRAQGVEMFAECAYTLEHHDHAVAFAAELRKGGNQ
ncbi:ead/Ea22-like family protein (plasmid) [Escherichia coli]|uniref:ead/Ea22-like family protein n=1 Tax=Salmonella enterica TaxID=28901 RepID=UPI001CC958AF|nr:ead/Ea22-like family protein [Salmonella enterica]MDJ2592938.1 ead/Ea22-like family protein [Salmonella enterica]